MNGQTLNKLNLFLGGLVLFSILLFPDFVVKSSLPRIQFVDFLLPVIMLVIFLQRKLLIVSLLYKILAVFFGWILLTIMINGRIDQLRDYFELYKILKFGCIIGLFSLLNFEDVFHKILKPVFLLLVVVNLLHYFNVFNFNYLIKEYYNGGIHIDTFGLNSIGEPDIKRMIGFAGNPNVNAVIFSLFSLIFLVRSRDEKRSIWLFSIATFMLFLCQSRTNFLAFVVVFLSYLFVSRPFIKHDFKLISAVFFTFFLSFIVSSNSYMLSLINPTVVQTNSVMGRLEVWQLLGEMIIQKPIFGHGPNKDFFYDRNLYPESEYVLQTWRYGFVGVGVFLAMLFSPLYHSKNVNLKMLFALALAVILINSLTNNPFTDRQINVFFAALIGVFIGSKKMINYA